MSVLPKRRRATRGVAGVAAAVLTVALASCGGESEPFEWPDDPPPEDAAAQPQPQVPADAAEAAAIEDILTAFHAFRELEVESRADPQPTYVARRDFSAYLADPLLSKTLSALNDLYATDIVFEGRPTWEPTVIELQLDATPPTAVVHDCLDATEWRSVFRDTDEPVPGNGLSGRYAMRIDAKLFPEGWLFHDASMKEETQC
jgi:hypothetical protein